LAWSPTATDCEVAFEVLERLLDRDQQQIMAPSHPVSMTSAPREAGRRRRERKRAAKAPISVAGRSSERCFR
jgi:hypothetical protein